MGWMVCVVLGASVAAASERERATFDLGAWEEYHVRVFRYDIDGTVKGLHPYLFELLSIGAADRERLAEAIRRSAEQVGEYQRREGKASRVRSEVRPGAWVDGWVVPASVNNI